MRRRSSSREELPQYPEYLIPVLVHYGFEDGITEDLGSRPIACAFHGDKTPSATVNTSVGWFNCHVFPDCPSGNAVQIIMKKESIDYASALERAAKISAERGVAVQRSPRGRGGLARSKGDRSGARTVRRTWGGGG